MRIREDPVFLPRSGFQIFLDPVSAQILEQKKSAEMSLKVIYQKKTITKGRQLMKKATISYS